MTTHLTDPARAWVDVDLDALTANARAVAERSGRPLLPMVKANGYGVGAVAVARTLEPLDPWGYGVATLTEAAELRDAGIGRPIVVFTPLIPAGAAPCFHAGLRPVIGSADSLRAWLGLGTAPFHIEVDTGMGRGGVRWDDAVALAEFAALLKGAEGWEGAFTHFHSAESDPASVTRQWERFQAALSRLPHRPPLIHAANSAVALRGGPETADLVRPGIFLYGCGIPGLPAPRPVAALRAPVVAVRQIPQGESVSYGATWRAATDTTVATLGAGYADGVMRSLSGRGQVELGGQRGPDSSGASRWT